MTAVAALCPARMLAQHTERHLNSDPARTLYRRSAFAHGYIHGYEDGFHDAGMDLYLGRTPRVPQGLKDSRRPKTGYNSSFGSKSTFQMGYQNGYREAYADVARGDRFRAVSETTTAAANLDPSRPADEQFDSGIAAGYEAGRAHAQAGQPQNLDYLVERCHANDGSGDYCEGYSRGFRLGHADGSVNRPGTQTQTAQKK